MSDAAAVRPAARTLLLFCDGGEKIPTQFNTESLFLPSRAMWLVNDRRSQWILLLIVWHTSAGHWIQEASIFVVQEKISL